MRKQTFHKVLLIVLSLSGLGLFLLPGKTAQAANPNLINFQGKVVNSDDTNVTNGTYSFNFVLFDDPTLGSESDGVHDKWHELSKSVDVTNGVFQTELGSATALPDFSQFNALYLGIKFNGDTAGYMTPRIHLDSVPYAKYSDNAGALSGLAATNFVQLAQGLQTDSTTTNGSIAINKTGASGDILLLEANSKKALEVNNSGTVLLGQAGASGLNGTLTFNNSVGSNTVSLSLQADPGSSYTLLLPTTGPSTSQCLQTDSVTASQLKFGSCAAGGSGAFTSSSGVISQATSTDALNLIEGQAGDYGLKVSSSVAPTVDLVQIVNGNASATDGVDGLALNWTSANASGDALHITPAFSSTTTGKTFNGLEFDAFSPTNTTGTDTVNGINIGALTDPGASITSNALTIGTGWDTGINVSDTTGGSANHSSTGISVSTQSDTFWGSATKTGLSINVGPLTELIGPAGTYNGIVLASPGAAQVSGSYSLNWNGANITTADVSTNSPSANINENGIIVTNGAASILGFGTSSSVNQNGLKLVTGSISQANGTITENGLAVDLSSSTFTTGGLLNGISITPMATESTVASSVTTGIKIGNITTSGNAGVSNALTIGSGWDTGLSIGSTASGQSGVNVTGASIALPADSSIGFGTKTGLSITSGAITEATANTGTYSGAAIAIPGLTANTSSSAILNAYGLNVTGGAIAVGNGAKVNEYGIYITPGNLPSSGTGTATETGLYIDSGTTSIGSGVSGSLTGISLKVGNLGSLAQYSGLNIGANGGTVTFSPGAAVKGINLDLSTGITADGVTETGLSLVSSGDNSTASSTKTGLSISSGDIKTQTAATGKYIGEKIALPTLTTQTNASAALNAYGLQVVTGGQTQTTGSLSQYGLNVDIGGNINSGGFTGIKVGASSPRTINSSAVVAGLDVNLSGNISADAVSMTGLSVETAGAATDAGSANKTGLFIGSDIISLTSANTSSYTGGRVDIPQITVNNAGGTFNSAGLLVNTGNLIQTSGSLIESGISVLTNSGTYTSGTLNGLNIGGVSDPGAAVTSSALKIGSGWDKQVNGTGWSVDGSGNLTVAGCAGCGGLTTVAYSGTPNANGGSISGNTLTLTAADGSNPGLLSASAQTIGGDKTLTGATLVKLGSASAFQVQTSSAASIFNVDSTNSRIGVDATYASMTAPTSLAATNPNNGTGALTAGSYLYYVTAVDSLGGETGVSNESATCTTASTNLNCSLSWTASTGASAYRVYRTNSSGVTTTEKYLTTVLTNSYIDAGAVTLSSIGYPASNTAYVSTNTSNSLAQISIGGLGTPTGQVYVSGIAPTFVGMNAESSGGPYDVFVQGRYAYVTLVTGKLGVYDVSNPAAPHFLAVNSDSNLSFPRGVYVQGHYAYVASSSNNKLVIYNVSNPASPTFVASNSDTALSGPYSVYVQGRYAYVVSKDNAKLVVYDVSNPASPTFVANNSDSNLNNPIYLYVQGRYAYVESSTNIEVYDISNPANPTFVAKNSDTNLNAGTAPAIYVQGRYAYIATSTKLLIYDVSNPASPTFVGINSDSNLSTPQSMYVQGRYAYLVNSANNKLTVYDISNPARPTFVALNSDSNLNLPIGLFVQGRYAYVASGGNSELVVYDLGGEYAQQLEAGGIETGTLQVDTNGQVAGDFNIQGGLNVGQSVQAAGPISTATGIKIASTGNTGSVSLSLGSTTNNVTLTLPSSLPGASNYCIVSSNLGILSFLPCGAGATASVTLAPEYAGAVMTGVGGSNTGTMTSDYCAGTNKFPSGVNTSVCNSGTNNDEHNYYSWTANSGNSYDIFVRWQTPSDFSSFSSGSFYYWKTASGDAVTMNVYPSSSSTCATQSASGTSAAWASQSITMSGCTPSAGSVMTIDIHLSVGNNGNFARIGEITLTYNRN